MNKNVLQLAAALLTTVILFSCDTLKTLPTNTTGGVFSLNGTWRLASTTDGDAMVGTKVTVYPVVGNATVKSLAHNTYCIRERDEVWSGIKSNNTGGFSIQALVNACNGTTIYKAATISVVNNDKITVAGITADNRELVQAWSRVQE